MAEGRRRRNSQVYIQRNWTSLLCANRNRCLTGTPNVRESYYGSPPEYTIQDTTHQLKQRSKECAGPYGTLCSQRQYGQHY